jgi:type IV pilus assembly protein PilW
MNTVKHSSQHGLTLIELMIALLIGVFLTAGLIQIFISSKQSYRLQENISRLQENGRFAMDFLTKGIRMAGYTGCSSSATNTHVIADPTKFSTVSSLTAASGLNNVANNWNKKACGANNECIVGTDVINFMSSDSCGGNVIDPGNSANPTADIKIVAPNTCNIAAGEIVIVSDCSSADVFGATNVSNGTSSGQQTIAHGITNSLNTDTKLSKVYQSDAQIFSPQLMSYFIRSGASGIPSLWRFNSTHATSSPEELIEGIENMQVLYGIDTDLGATDCPPSPTATAPAGCFVPNYYVTAASISTANPCTPTPTLPCWSQVVSIRISLVAVSIENNLVDAPQPYTYLVETGGSYDYKSITPPNIYVNSQNTSQVCQSNTSGCVQKPDLRLRRVFSSTIAIRNRLL